MFSAIRKRFTYANVAMTLALVFAMTGGAYAAKHYLITSTKQISPKVLKHLYGKAGPAGKEGPAGPVGAAGKEGPAGKEGLVGKEGAKGETGTVGKEGAKGATGATGSQGATGATGPQGATGATGPQGATGSQGATGATGAQGEPWTPNNTLPSKASEKGQWATYISAAGVESVTSAGITFPIPLKAALAEAHVHFLAAGAKGKGSSEGCPTTSSVSNPEAEPGNLCIFTASLSNLSLFFILDQETNGTNVSGRTGTTLIFASVAEGFATAGGTWAVTEK